MNSKPQDPAKDISQTEANELRDILQTLVPSGRAFITSARELRALWEGLKITNTALQKEIAQLKEDARHNQFLGPLQNSQPHTEKEKELVKQIIDLTCEVNEVTRILDGIRPVLIRKDADIADVVSEQVTRLMMKSSSCEGNSKRIFKNLK